MPDIAEFHPQLVHFAIVLGFVGVGFRLASFTKWFTWAGPAGAALLIAGGALAWFTAESGHQAHGPVERIPGAAQAVQEHEEWGDRARNAFLIVAALELIALGLGQRKVAGPVRALSAAAGLGLVFALYEAGEHGGELVYQYAGGPGIRSGDTTDVRRLLVAGLYAQAERDRASGNKVAAARLTDELVRQMPADPDVALLSLTSRLKDRGDAAGALAALHAYQPGDNRRGIMRRGMLMADAYQALGATDSARAVLEALKREMPRAADRIDEALRQLGPK